jgi:hypothetical protein
MSKDYRKIWIKHHGPIPVDSEGRSYEIHHIDGNHKNNDINNLLCVPIHMHYQIHLEQGEYWAANLIANKINMPTHKGFKMPPFSEETKKKMSDAKIGFKPWNTGISLKDLYTKEERKKKFGHKKNRGRVHTEEAVKNMSEAQQGRIVTEEHAKKISDTLTGRPLSEAAKDKMREKVECPHCKNMIGRSGMTRYHFHNCKSNPNGPKYTGD